ncbi:MAG TPA: hypothetical protein VF862_14940 [Gemmatimonadales bacterium]
MTKAAKSVLYFAYYLIALSAVLVAVPNLMLETFGMPATGEVWIRVVGVTVFCLGAYYIVAARTEFLPLIRLTVPVRVIVCGSFAAFAAVGWAEPPLVLFGLVDLAGAVWTQVALRAG